MKLFQVLAFGLCILSVSFLLSAAEDDWSKIAEKTVSFKSEVDTVSPLSPFANTSFSHIKIQCTQGTVNLKSIKVVMNDGREKFFDSLGVLTKGMSSRNLSLPAGEKVKLNKIELNYESVGSVALKVAGVTEKAKVEILGKKTKSD